MGWKGALRDYQAATRRIERNSVRRTKELHKRQLQYQKMQAAEAAKHEVEIYENLMERLITLHKDCETAINWSEKAAKPSPLEPIRLHVKEKLARDKLDNYKPNFLDRLFHLQNWQIKRKKKFIEKSKKIDEEAFQKSHAEYVIDLRQLEFAKKMITGDPEAYVEIAKDCYQNEELKGLGTEVIFRYINKDEAEVLLHVNSESVVPKNSKSLLKSGKVSEKPIPTARYHQIYQDHLCSCLLRFARETFAALPVKIIYISELIDFWTRPLVTSPIKLLYRCWFH